MFTDPAKNIEQFGLSKGMRVADFGSGSGFYARGAAKAVGSEGRVYAIDLQKDLLSKVKSEAQKEGLFNVEIIWGDVEKPNGTKLRNDLLDAVIFSNILFQVKDKVAAIREAARVLKKDGKAYVIDWSDSFGGLGPRQEDIVNSEKAKELFKEANFEFEKELIVGEHHYGLVFKKL